MKNVWLLFGTLVGMLVVVIGIAVVFTQKATAPIDMTRLLGDARIATGSATPKVTIVEFSDLQCPACKAAAPLTKSIVQQYPNEVKLVYRHFPLVTIHKNAYDAALAAETALNAGKFWEYHDILFERQDEWSELSAEEARAKFVEYAQVIGVDPEFMKTGLSQRSFETTITRDVSDANAVGIFSTPSFYVNGQAVQTQDLAETVENLVKSE
jgi:protein-disulfide isomerase